MSVIQGKFIRRGGVLKVEFVIITRQLQRRERKRSVRQVWCIKRGVFGARASSVLALCNQLFHAKVGVEKSRLVMIIAGKSTGPRPDVLATPIRVELVGCLLVELFVNHCFNHWKT